MVKNVSIYSRNVYLLNHLNKLIVDIMNALRASILVYFTIFLKIILNKSFLPLDWTPTAITTSD